MQNQHHRPTTETQPPLDDHRDHNEDDSILNRGRFTRNCGETIEPVPWDYNAAKSCSASILYDRYSFTNREIARKLRDSLTQTLTEFVKSKIMSGRYSVWKQSRIKTPQDFNKCDGKPDLISLLLFVKATRVCPDSIIDELIVDRNKFCNGQHINTRNKFCNGQHIKGLFEKVKELLSYLKLDSKEIDELEETFNSKVGISSKAITLENMTVEDLKVLLFLIENLDNTDVRDLISGVIAPRIKNVDQLIGRK